MYNTLFTGIMAANLGYPDKDTLKRSRALIEVTGVACFVYHMKVPTEYGTFPLWEFSKEALEVLLVDLDEKSKKEAIKLATNWDVDFAYGLERDDPQLLAAQKATREQELLEFSSAIS